MTLTARHFWIVKHPGEFPHMCICVCMCVCVSHTQSRWVLQTFALPISLIVCSSICAKPGTVCYRPLLGLASNEKFPHPYTADGINWASLLALTKPSLMPQMSWRLEWQFGGILIFFIRWYRSKHSNLIIKCSEMEWPTFTQIRDFFLFPFFFALLCAHRHTHISIHSTENSCFKPNVLLF